MPKENIGLLDKVLSGIVNDLFYNIVLKDKKFYYTENCIKCGICEKSCVLNNIELVDGHPHWRGNCTHCVACISKCPTRAIQYKNRTENKDTYLLKKIIKE